MAGLFREWRRGCRGRPAGEAARVAEPADPADPLPLVSVIVPVRNEAACLEGLLRGLAEQDYPEAEFIFVDDRSSDESAGMIRCFAEGRSRVTLITLAENPGPNHKQYALTRGIEAAAGSLLLFTDADCEVPPQWIRVMAGRMAEEKAGVSIGPVFKKYGGKGFLHLYQCFDHGVRYMYLAGSTGLGAAGGGFGNNLILRRAALEAVGGYGAVPPSPTEDAALISRIRSHSDYAIRALCDGDTPVMTRGEGSWRNLLGQTLRWNNGGLFSPDGATRFNFGFLMITISMGILALPLLPLIPSLWPLPAAVFLAMTLNTAATLALFGASLPRKGPGYILAAVFTPIYFTFLTILGFCGLRVRWKGEAVPSRAAVRKKPPAA
jgi:cellulose synthase/poly-beta-1,6-N-acetylglucosamine synthase-like glycosyltransferase